MAEARAWDPAAGRGAYGATDAPLQEHMGSGRSAGSEDGKFKDDPPGSLLCPNKLACCLSSCCFPAWLTALRTIKQREHAVVFIWGEYVGTLTEPGIACINPCGTSMQVISTQRRTCDIKDIKVADSKGNPIFISGNLAYQIYSAKKAIVDVKDIQQFVMQQAPMVMRKICAKYPYDSTTGPSLRGHGGDETVSEELRKMMQSQVADAGVLVSQYEITDLSYAPEIAAAMLQKQQSEAMVEARQLTVQAAVDISSMAIQRMKSKGHAITSDGEERIISNLLTVICSDRGVQPTLPTTS